MKKVAVFVFVVLTSSCNVSRLHVPVTIKDRLPIGSTLRLTQAVEIPADRSFIYIAHGKIAPLKNYNTVDVYQPYCMFRLDKEDAQVRQVIPDQFEVTKIVEWNHYYGKLDSPKYTNSKNNRGGLIKARNVSDDNGGASIVMYATVMSLHSAKQPEVKELVCGHWDVQSLVEPLTLEEMKSALGDLILVDIRSNTSASI